MAVLRAEMNALLAEVPAQRKPALRRADAADALLTTDLPLCAEKTAVSVFIRQAEAGGWRIMPRQGWLLLDHPVARPDAVSADSLPGEAGCCLSLLMRHPDDRDAAADAVRALCKASEKGEAALQQLCRQWHGQWAAYLRLGESLPAGLSSYLIQAYRDAQGG